jgi:hypothetical protein
MILSIILFCSSIGILECDFIASIIVSSEEKGAVIGSQNARTGPELEDLEL